MDRKQRWHSVSLLALPAERLAALANVRRSRRARAPVHGVRDRLGLGALRRVVLAFVFGGELVTLLDSRARTDGVQMPVALDRTIMEAFASNFIVPAASGSGSDE
jgi:hypothetical protein